jgi:hypothetical protein
VCGSSIQVRIEIVRVCEAIKINTGVHLLLKASCWLGMRIVHIVHSYRTWTPVCHGPFQELAAALSEQSNYLNSVARCCASAWPYPSSDGIGL